MNKKIIANLLIFIWSIRCFASGAEFKDRCEEKLGAVLPNGGSTFANTRDANSTDNLQLLLVPCGPNNEFFDLNNAGVFYTLEGTGAKMRITTCSTQAEFISRVSVFSSCDSKSCIDSAAETKETAGNRSTCFNEKLKAALEFQSTADVAYSLFVQDDKAGKSGDFALTVEELPPDNALCGGIQRIELDETYTGTTGGSVTSTNATACNGISPNGPGVWFEIPGVDDDTEVVMVTCSKQPFYFLVYEGGNCSALSCVEVKRKPETARLCGDGTVESRVAWDPNRGSAYYVHMFAAEGAQWRLSHGRPLMNRSSAGSIWSREAASVVVLTVATMVIWLVLELS